MSDGSCTKTDSVMDMKKEDTKSSKETGEKNENEEEEIGEIFIEILKYNIFKGWVKKSVEISKLVLGRGVKHIPHFLCQKPFYILTSC